MDNLGKQADMNKCSEAMTRFMAKVDRTDTCWLWTAYKSDGGYGRFRYEGKMWAAHRWLYEQTVAKVPAHLQLDHLCRVRHCVNPDHLEPVTGQVNVLRSVAAPALNAAKDRCQNGHEFTEGNTYIRRSKYGHPGRVCRSCERERDRLRYAQGKHSNSRLRKAG